MLSRRDVAKNRLEGRKVGRSIYLSQQIRQHELQLIIQNKDQYQARIKTLLSNLPEYPSDKYSGRGIVICAGGPRYFTCA